MIHICTDKTLKELVSREMRKLSPDQRPYYSPAELCHNSVSYRYPSFEKAFIMPGDSEWRIEAESGLPEVIRLCDVEEYPAGIVFPDRKIKAAVFDNKCEEDFHSYQVGLSNWSIFAYDFHLRRSEVSTEKNLNLVAEVHYSHPDFLNEKDLATVLGKIKADKEWNARMRL